MQQQHGQKMRCWIIGFWLWSKSNRWISYEAQQTKQGLRTLTLCLLSAPMPCGPTTSSGPAAQPLLQWQLLAAKPNQVHARSHGDGRPVSQRVERSPGRWGPHPSVRAAFQSKGRRRGSGPERLPAATFTPPFNPATVTLQTTIHRLSQPFQPKLPEIQLYPCFLPSYSKNEDVYHQKTNNWGPGQLVEEKGEP
jgi:hypothetical protein